MARPSSAQGIIACSISARSEIRALRGRLYCNALRGRGSGHARQTSARIPHFMARYRSRVYLCALVKLKDDDIVAAFISTHMHTCSMGINFHEIVLPREKSENQYPA